MLQSADRHTDFLLGREMIFFFFLSDFTQMPEFYGK